MQFLKLATTVLFAAASVQALPISIITAGSIPISQFIPTKTITTTGAPAWTSTYHSTCSTSPCKGTTFTDPPTTTGTSTITMKTITIQELLLEQNLFKICAVNFESYLCCIGNGNRIYLKYVLLTSSRIFVVLGMATTLKILVFCSIHPNTNQVERLLWKGKKS